MPTNPFTVLSTPEFADKTNRQLLSLSDLESVRTVGRFLRDYASTNGWHDLRSRDLLNDLKERDDYDQLVSDLTNRDDTVPYYAWACRLLNDGHTSLALMLLATARRLQNLRSSERAFCEAAVTSVAQNILGEVRTDTLSWMGSLFETLKANVSPLRLSAERRQSLGHLADAPEENGAVFKTELETYFQQSGWVDEDGLLNSDSVLAGEPAPFLDLTLELIKSGDNNTLDLAVRLTSFVAHATGCAPARWVLRCFKANCEVEALSVDTSNPGNYVLPYTFDSPQAENDHTTATLSQGQVLLAPNYPSGTASRHSERGMALKNHKALSEPMVLVSLRGDVSTLHTQLMVEFPWIERLTDRICHDLDLRQSYGQSAIQIPPLLLWGAPGSGKTRYVNRLAEHLGLPTATLSFAGSADDRMLRGTGAGWGSAQPAFPVTKVAESKCANPLLIVDEIEKAAASAKSAGDPWSTLLMFLEPQNATTFFDECLMTAVDLSRINWIATANDTKRLPMPLLSRFRVIETPKPETKHLASILHGVRQDLGSKLGIDTRFIPELDEVEVVFLERAFHTTRNIRTVIRLTENLLQRRERKFRELPN